MDKRRVVITGIGVVSPYGAGLQRFWQALAGGESARRPIQGFDASVYRSAQGGEAPAELLADAGARARCGDPGEDSAYFLALAAAEALADAGLGAAFSDEDRVGCVLGTLCAGMRNMREYGAAYESGLPSPVAAETIPAHYQLDFLARRHNLTGPSSLVSTACSSTTDALGYAFDLIRGGECDSCLSGGGDVLAEMIHAAFNGLYSITTGEPRPFDSERDGFFIGEGAGLFHLETLESARARGARIHAEILGYGLSNTGHHLTATSEDGAGEALAIRRALDDAGLAPADIDYINCHGTGTRHNDASEIRAINLVFGDAAERLHISSNKASIGHCMGAAGALEAAATVLALENSLIPPTLHTRGDEAELRSRLVGAEARPAALRRALSQSFGFGGACSCIVFGHYREDGHA